VNVASHLRAGTVFDLIIVLLRIYALYQFNLVAVLLAILYAVTVEFRQYASSKRKARASA